jgi:hypothetical protein
MRMNIGKSGEKREGRVLTPKGHLPLAEHHFHDLHKQVSNLLVVDPLVVPQYQTYVPDHV